MVDVRIFIFNNSLKQVEVPYFRAAVSKHLGGDVLLHNHTESGLRNKLPLIQYKIIQGKPAIVAINEGIHAVSPLLEMPAIKVNIGKRPVTLRLDSVWENSFALQMNHQGSNSYKLQNWLPLNEDNYAAYKNTSSLVEKIKLLEQILVANILSFSKGVGVFYEEEIKVSITNLSNQALALYKNVKLFTCDVEFSTNVHLPEYVGLGKGVSRGFGSIVCADA